MFSTNIDMSTVKIRDFAFLGEPVRSLTFQCFINQMCLSVKIYKAFINPRSRDDLFPPLGC